MQKSVKKIFINLKRFEVPRLFGGVSDHREPEEWAAYIIEGCARLGLGELADMPVIFFFPEALLLTARRVLKAQPCEKVKNMALGCQGVFREDLSGAPGGNFGAFTTHRPATAMRILGSAWTIIGHSEERREKLELIARFAPQVEKDGDPQLAGRAKAVVDTVMNEEVKAALQAGLQVLLCVGETVEEKGEGSAAAQRKRVRQVLRRQLVKGLAGIGSRPVVIAYEPVWAIGPGKVPPGGEYIGFVSAYIKEVVKAEFGYIPEVVYGGGLKKENAGEIGGVPTIDGGLVALTRFSGDIGFHPEDLRDIIQAFRQGAGIGMSGPV